MNEPMPTVVAPPPQILRKNLTRRERGERDVIELLLLKAEIPWLSTQNVEDNKRWINEKARQGYLRPIVERKIRLAFVIFGTFFAFLTFCFMDMVKTAPAIFWTLSTISMFVFVGLVVYGMMGKKIVASEPVPGDIWASWEKQWWPTYRNGHEVPKQVDDIAARARTILYTDLYVHTLKDEFHYLEIVLIHDGKICGRRYLIGW